MLAFFGLRTEDRMGIFTQIHEILFYGQGGYDYATVYNMPLWLRKFTFFKMKEHYDTISGANSDKYLVNEDAVPNPNKVPIPQAVQKAAANYTTKTVQKK